MKLNIYKDQKNILKTLEISSYDIMFGTIEDVLAILDDIENLNSDIEVLTIIKNNLPKLKELLIDIFGKENLSKDDLKKIKLKELVPLFIDLISYVKNSFTDNEKN